MNRRFCNRRVIKGAMVTLIKITCKAAIRKGKVGHIRVQKKGDNWADKIARRTNSGIKKLCI